MGQSYQSGECANGARMAVLEAGWPDSVPGVTLNRRSCSGLDAIFFAAMKIQTGNAEIVVAGGMESMSQCELYHPRGHSMGSRRKKRHQVGVHAKGPRSPLHVGNTAYDRIQRARVMSQPIERYGELNSMMTWAEAAAKQENIFREEADAWSLRSHQKAISAMDEGRLAEEIAPVAVAKKNEPPGACLAVDETPGGTLLSKN